MLNEKAVNFESLHHFVYLFGSSVRKNALDVVFLFDLDSFFGI